MAVGRVSPWKQMEAWRAQRSRMTAQYLNQTSSV